MTILQAMSSIISNRIVLQCMLWCFGFFISNPVHSQVSARIGFNGNILGAGTILNVCANSVLTFSDSSLNASDRLWTFKHGNPSQSQLPALSVSFSNPGADSVILRSWSGIDTASTFIRVNVFSQIDAGVVGNTQNICFGARPDTLRFLIAPSGGGGSYSFQWQISTDSINYVNVPSATNATFRPDTLRLSRYIRVIVSSTVGCGSDTSNSVFIRVWNDLTPPQISGNQSICFNSSTTLFRTQNATGGDGAFNYQWQRFVSGAWSDIAGQTADSLITGNLTQSASFRLRATSNFGCGQRFSDSTRITVFPAIDAGLISTNQNICFASRPDTLRFSTNPSGGGNAYSYQWQVSTDSVNYSNVLGAVGQTYRPDTLQLTRFYRLIVTSTLNCGSDTSNAVRILVYRPFVVGSIAGNDTICFNTRPDTMRLATIPTGGNGTYSYQWLTSTNNVSWSIVAGETSTTYRPGNLTGNRYYRLLMQSGEGCGSDTSNAVFIRVWNDLTPPQISSHQSICFNSSTTLFRTQNATGGDGAFSYQWQRFVSGAWSDIAGQTADSLITGNLTLPTSFRLRATSNFGCGQRFSDSTRITVFPALDAGLISMNQNICFASRPDTLRFGTNPSGGGNAYSYQWQVSTDSVNFSNVLGALGQTYRPDTLQLTRFYRLIVTSTLNCGSDTSNVVRILVYRPFVVGGIAGNDTICFNTRPDTMRLATIPTGGNGIYSYQWLTSTNNVNWSVVAGETSTTYRPGNLTGNRYYRLLMQSGEGCGSDSSNAVFVYINPLPDTAEILGPVSVCRNQLDVLYELDRDTSLYLYQWEVDRGTITSGMFTSQVYIDWGALAGIDTIKVKQINRLTGCTNDMLLPVHVQNESAPSRANIISKPNTNILVCSDSITGTTYQWGWINKSNGTEFLIPNSNRQYVLLPHNFDSTSFLYFVITSRNGCMTRSFMNFNLTAPTSVSEQSIKINVYPNPSGNGEFRIDLECEEITDVLVMDALGRHVPFDFDSFDCYYLIRFEQPQKGLHFMSVKLRNGTQRHFKLIVN